VRTHRRLALKAIRIKAYGRDVEKNVCGARVHIGHAPATVCHYGWQFAGNRLNVANCGKLPYKLAFNPPLDKPSFCGILEVLPE